MIYLLEDDAGIRKLIVYTLKGGGMDAEGFALPSLFLNKSIRLIFMCCFS